VHWEPTDQFGNLYIGQLAATTIDDFRGPIRSMLTELAERATGDIRLTIDLEFAEINGPDPDQVSHILRSPWFEIQMEAGRSPDHILEMFTDLVAEESDSAAGASVIVRLA